MREFQSGFESGSTLTEFIAGGNTTNLSFVTSPVHAGTYAARFTGIGYLFGTLATPRDAAWLRWYHRISSTSIANPSRIGVLMSATGHLASLRLRTDRQLELIQDGYPYGMVSMQLSGFQMPINEWVCLELFVDVSSLLVATRYNGTPWATRSALVNFASAGLIDRCVIGPDEAATTGCDQFYDDVAVNSRVGRINSFWPGVGPGTRNYPPSSDAESQWSGGTARYTEVDEAIPDDNATYMFENTFVAGKVQGFYVVLDRDWPISAVQVGMRATYTGGTGASVQVSWHDPQDLTIVGSTKALTSTWTSYFPILTLEDAWDNSRRVLNTGYLNQGASRLIFVRTTGGGSSTILISTVWVVVDYAMQIAAQPTPHAYPAQPQILVELEP